MYSSFNKYWAPAAVLACSLAANVPAFAASADEIEVARAVDVFRAAMVAGDGKALTALAHPNLQFGHSNGVTQTREEFVKTVVDKSEIFRAIDLTGKSVKIVGDLAIQRHVFNADILLDGKPLIVSLGLLETWQRHPDGRWLLLARQAYNTKAPMPPKTAMTATNEVPRRGWTKTDESEVAQAVESFRKAMVAGDGAALTALAAPDLSFGHSNGVVQSREVFVGTVVRKEEVFRNIALTNKSLKIVGDTAIQRHVFNADILLGDTPLFVALGCVEIWQRQADGRWLLTARQAYNTNPPAATETADVGLTPLNAGAASPAASMSSVAAGAVAAAAQSAVARTAAENAMLTKAAAGKAHAGHDAGSAYAPKRTARVEAPPVARTRVAKTVRTRATSRRAGHRTVHASAHRLRKQRTVRAAHAVTDVRAVTEVQDAHYAPARPTLVWPGDGPGQRKLLDGLRR